MKILLWGGKSMARISIEMIVEQFQKKAIISEIFDAKLAKPTFSTDLIFENTASGLSGLIGKSSHFVVFIGGEHGFAKFQVAPYCRIIYIM